MPQRAIRLASTIGDTARPTASTDQGTVGITPGCGHGGPRGLNYYRPLGAGNTARIGAGRGGTDRGTVRP
jgi:hypothetical protein